VTINVLRDDAVLDSVEEVVPYRQYTVGHRAETALKANPRRTGTGLRWPWPDAAGTGRAALASLANQPYNKPGTQRCTSTQVRELELLTRMAGLDTAGLYGEMALGCDLEHEEAYRMVALYKKPEAAAA
jgi:hypothetical protein